VLRTHNTMCIHHNKERGESIADRYLRGTFLDYRFPSSTSQSITSALKLHPTQQFNSTLQLNPSTITSKMNPSSTHYMQAYPYQAYPYAGAGAVDGLRQRAHSQEWPSSFCPMPIRGTQSWPGQPRTTRPPSIWEEDLRQLPTGEIGVVGLRNQYGEVVRHSKFKDYSSFPCRPKK